MMNDVVTAFAHTYEIKFIIDNSKDYSRFGELNLGLYDRIFVVIDKNVKNIYGNVLLAKLKIFEKEIFIHEISPQEISKSIDYYPILVDFLETNTAGRYDAVVAIGGGICLDLVSFTVSTYMRGLPFFMIPTTLIGETDASTAGKTCLNAHNTKNLLGTFYYPKIVYNNIFILRECPKRITRQGLSEAFKYSLLTDGEIIPEIIKFQNNDFDCKIMEKIVHKTIESRIAIRNVDPLASNLGHTFGHALEKYSDYSVLHGDAIMTGTVMSLHYSVEKGLMETDERDRIFQLIQDAHLNIWIPDDLDVRKLVNYMRKDKKSSSKKLHLVLIKGIGKPYRSDTPFYEADYDDMEAFLERYVNSYKYKTSDYSKFLQQEVLK